MGTVAFLLGDGRYGIFEIVKHVAPGLICDLTVPLLTRGGREPGRIAWTLEGALIGAGRFATIFCSHARGAGAERSRGPSCSPASACTRRSARSAGT